MSTQEMHLLTTKQAMLTALAFVQDSLERLEHIRFNDEAWDEKDVDVDYAVGLALVHIKSLRATLPSDRAVFDNQWFMAAAAVALSARTFSRTDCHYFRALASLQKKFEVLRAMVEFVALENKGVEA